MRFQFDVVKSREVKRKHGVSLEEATGIFDQAHLSDRKNDNPEPFRAIGWSGARLCSVIFEIRRDREGEFYHLITAWKATHQEEKALANKSRPLPSADEIAEMATRGEDVSKFFTDQFTVVRPVRRVNVDLTQGMLRELDERAARLNVSRQAVIKTLLRQALDQGGSHRTTSKHRAG